MSIAERVGFLRASEREPDLATQHHRHLRELAGIGLSLSVLLIAATTIAGVNMQFEEQASYQQRTIMVQTTRQHWQRVGQFLPEEPTGPLALAELELRLGNPGAALTAAQKALRRAKNSEARARAQHLFERASKAKPLDNEAQPSDK